MSILEEGKPRVLKLADGKEYELPVINLTTLANLESSLGFGLGKLQEKIEEEPATTMRAVIFALLKVKNRKLTIDKVGELITLEVMSDVSDVMSQLMAI